MIGNDPVIITTETKVALSEMNYFLNNLITIALNNKGTIQKVSNHHICP